MILPGNGLTAVDNGDQLIGGSLTFLNDRIGVPDDVKTVAAASGGRREDASAVCAEQEDPGCYRRG